MNATGSSFSMITLKLSQKFGANRYRFLHTADVSRTRRNSSSLSSTTKIRSNRIRNSQNQQQQQVNLSVLRFTLGIPGLDESYLPRWIGYAFGSLLLLNHFVGSDSSAATPAQLRTEVVGLFLAAFSVVLPFLGKFLPGSNSVAQASIPEGFEQIFVMSQEISDTFKEDLAWGSYILLQNTNTISVLISVEDAICVRGYWNTPKFKDSEKVQALEWFEEQIQQIGLSNLTDTLYFPQNSDSNLWEMLPKGTRSLLLLPVLQAPDGGAIDKNRPEGFVLLASSIDYAYSTKDRAWIAAIANKFRG